MDNIIDFVEPDYQKFFNPPFDLFLIADCNGKTLHVNENWGKIFGYSKCELESKDFTEFVHPDDLTLTVNKFKEILQ